MFIVYYFYRCMLKNKRDRIVSLGCDLVFPYVAMFVDATCLTSLRVNPYG